MIFFLHNKAARDSVIGAVILHLALIVGAMNIQLRNQFQDPKEKLTHFRMRSADSSTTVVRRSENKTSNQLIKTLKLRQKTATSSLKPIGDISIGDYAQDQKQAASLIDPIKPKAIEISGSPTENPEEFEKIVTKTEERNLKDQIPSKQRSTATVFSEADRVKSSKNYQVNQDTLLKSLIKPLQELSLYVPENMTLDPEEGMPGFTPSVASNNNISLLDSKVGESKGDITPYESIDQFLDIEVFTYQDPSDSKKYFMIKIFPKKGVSTFRVMPKEILFAIDCSLSISHDRLEEFKKGIALSLSHLNQGDIFNIVAFKDKATFFSPKSMVATPETIKEAERFVLELTPSKQTDVYNVIKQIVDKPLGREPSDIFLLSDGRPTHGVVDARELLNSITRTNKKTRPVFVFSGGGKVNRYLLDFIAYQNRGWSEYTKKIFDIDKALYQFYQKIKDPIFLHLRYRLNGLNEKEIYPKSLPDFFANAEFTVYGTYENENEFSMQLLGDIDGKTKELIFSRSLKDAKKGSEEIMKGYGFNKIYSLINQVTIQGNKPELLKEIDSLSKKYSITTPYSPELANID